MGLDMRPIGKPKPGFEQRFLEIFERLVADNFPPPSFLDSLKGKKAVRKDDLLEEWFAHQIPAYETIKAPRVGRDQEADVWAKAQYQQGSQEQSLKAYLKDLEGYYVISLAKETVGVPVYIALGQDEHVFRGAFLKDCVPLLGQALVNEAWETKLAAETLDYGNRLLEVADRIAQEKQLEYLKAQRIPPDSESDTIEFQLHVVFSLAKWLIFYGQHGHGYEADY